MTKYQPPKDPNGLSRLVRTWYEPWMEEAECAYVDPELWFPEKGGSPRDARRICARCPVSDLCRDYAVLNRERWGVWGNTSERQRRELFREAS